MTLKYKRVPSDRRGRGQTPADDKALYRIVYGMLFVFISGVWALGLSCGGTSLGSPDLQDGADAGRVSLPQPPVPSEPAVEDCANGIDDDGDGGADSADTNCAEINACAAPPLDQSASSNTADMVEFLYTGADPRLAPSGDVEAVYIYATLAHSPDLIIEPGGNVYRIIHDHVGSPRLVVHVDTCEVVQRIEYDEFGRVLLDTNPGFSTFGFAGGLYDPDTGLVRFGARDYDPEIGRWTSKDPAGFGGGDTNLYAYAGSDPVNYVDPNGEIAFLLPLAWAIAQGAVVGAAIDGGIELATQLIQSGGDLGCVDGGDVGASAGTGAVMGVAGRGLSAIKGLKAAKGGPGKMCFAEGTVVETNQGYVAIENIAVGDWVWSRDDQTGEEGWRRAVRVFVTPDAEVLEVRLLEADGDEQELIVTPEHPLWSLDGWAAVGELGIGEWVWARDGRAQVVAVASLGERQTVYNFEVEGAHTYFVGQGGVWVHKPIGSAKAPHIEVVDDFDTHGEECG